MSMHGIESLHQALLAERDAYTDTVTRSALDAMIDVVDSYLPEIIQDVQHELKLLIYGTIIDTGSKSEED